ncbi:2360_t:CDS:2, partial [Gigaspora margarita]
MSTVIKSSEVSSLLAIEVPYDNYFVLIAYERWSLSHYVATIRENYKYAVKDKAYHCFYKALERFAGDPDTAKEICDMSNTLIKERRADKITSKICRDLLKPFEPVPRKVEDLKVLINAPLACKLPVSANIHERRIQKFTYLDATDRDCQLASHISYILGEAIPWRFKEDSKSEDMLHMPLDLLITNTLELFKESVGIPLSIDRNKSDSGYTTKGYFRPDFVCRIKEALIFKGEEKSSHVSIKTAEKELKEKFNRIDPQ